MCPTSASTPAKRLLEAIEMHQLGCELMRGRLRREDPTATEIEIDRALRAWLCGGLDAGSSVPRVERLA
jgi:hypothetical protein